MPDVDKDEIAREIAAMHAERKKATKADRERQRAREQERENREAGKAANERTLQAVADADALRRLKASATARERFAAELAGPIDPDATIYADVAALLAGDLRPHVPDAGAMRSDGERMLYSASVNGLVGLSEAGKGLVATANAADELRLEGRVLWVDKDDNGAGPILEKLAAADVPAELLTDPGRFRIVDKVTAQVLRVAIADAATWRPTLVVIDSVTELVSMQGGNPNLDVDYVAVHGEFLRPFADLGAAVLVIDHAAKTSPDSGTASGTGQKKAKIDGAYYGVRVIDQFTPGDGGSSVLTILKDRHGGVRATTPGSRAAVFKLDSRAGVFTWEFWRGRADEETGSTVETDAAFVTALEPFPSSVKDLQAVIKAKSPEGKGWRDQRARDALKAARDLKTTTFPLNNERKK